MFSKIVHFSIRRKLFVALTTLLLLAGGIYSMLTLPIDAVPDITNNQVQIVTVSPTLAPQEVEQLITFPIEIAMSNVMNVEEIRSVSRFGLSLVTVVFKEDVPTLDARQLVNEQIQMVSGEIPPELGTPELMPITTGLGEIYQYVLKVAPGYEDRYDAMELRTIQDWIVKRQLSGIPGIVEINSFGGYLKQYEVAVDPDALYSLNITIGEVFEALSRNNQNTGGSYIEKINRAYYIRSEGMIKDLHDVEQIVVTNRGGIPIHIGDIGRVQFGAPKRFGAMTKDGEGECVGGIAMMLKGANANVVTKELEKRVAKVQQMLPEGVSVEPYLNRSELVNRNISTVIRNLVEGAIIVFLVLIIFLGNVRAGLIVASVIPLAMLFAFILMRIFNVSANLMSLGAIDFGIVVDGSIVILEGILAHLYGRQLRGRTLSREEMNDEVEKGAGRVARSATFAVLIILIVFFPILTLSGIEGKYFTPMAKTLVFCIIGALILSLTYVPMMASLCLKRTMTVKRTFADRFFDWLNRLYRRTLRFSQPIQLRFNELMTGAKADIAIKLYGEDMAELYSKAREAARYVEQVPGAADVQVEQAMGLPQLLIHFDRAKIARYGIDIEELNTVIRTAYAGETAGVVFENERRFDLVVRLDKNKVSDLNIDKLFVRTKDNIQLPVSEVASIELENGPLQINRDATKRRVVIGVNVRDADIQQVVNQIRESLDKNVKLKPGYYFEYGGQFENLQNAISTLTVVIPIALMLILLLLFFAFHSITYSLVVFSTVPLSLIGGIVALWLRGLPFSISAGVGFIALFGVAVLNGILMINHFNDIRKRTRYPLTTSRIIAEGCPHLLRPVFLTGLVASLGFVPMAIAKSAGAEVQRPLATVVIGGLIVSTALTLIIIPAFYRIVSILAAKRLRRKSRRSLRKAALGLALLIAFVPAAQAQQTVTMEQAIEMAQSNNPRLKMAESEISLARVTKGEAWDGGSTSFSYSWGQLNGESSKDNELSIEQSLGSLLTPFYKNALANTQISKGESYRDMVKKEITAEVKRAWAYYQYAYHIDALYRGQKALAERLRNSGEQRYQQGDIDLAERNMITALATDLHTRWMEASEELNLAERRFAWTCYSDEALLPADTSLAVMQIQTDGLSLSSRHLDYFSAQVQEKRDMLKIERSRFFPEISVGYVRQKIAPLSGLNSWMVGVSFPILFFPQQSRAKQARINLQIANWQAEDNRRQLSNRVSELQNQLVRQRERLLYYQQAAVKEAEALQNSAVKKFQENETDISEFIQSLNAAREIRRGYIETVYAYNITVLELELYTE